MSASRIKTRHTKEAALGPVWGDVFGSSTRGIGFAGLVVFGLHAPSGDSRF